MTILEQITHEAESLSTTQRRQALRFIRSMRAPKPHKNGKVQTATPTVDKHNRKLHPALRAIAGMWKDRTDLPKDGAAASMVLRRRVMGRDEND